MFKRNHDFKIKIIWSFFLEDKCQYETDIPYLNFQKNGKITLNGSDYLGEFEFSGYEEDGYLHLIKKYNGGHSIFYVGKFEENILKLYYSHDKQEKQSISLLEAGEFNSLIEFEKEGFRLLQDENED